MTTMRQKWLLSAVGAVALLALVGCNSKTAKPQASTKPGVFSTISGKDIPDYTGSRATGAAKATGNTLTQTFAVSSDPVDVSRFYTDTLTTWTPIQPIQPGLTASDPYTAIWEHNAYRLTLAVDNAPRDAGDTPAIHFTLTLTSS